MVAEHEQLRASWTARTVSKPERNSAGLERRAHRAAHVHDRGPPPAASLMALGREAPLELRDDAVDRRQVLKRPARKRAVELPQRLRGRKRLRPLDQLALELAAQVTLERAQVLLRDRVRIWQRGALAARLSLQLERTADPLHVDADHARALALTAERRDREARE